MNNKTKNILAGACLGLVGMGCLTGCSMSDEQKAALDLVTEKSDEIITLLEENMQYNNTKLSKEDAAEKILIARNKWKLMQFDELEFSLKQDYYDGIFDKLKDSYTSDGSPLRWLYRKNEDIKVFAIVEGDEFDDIIISNFQANKHLKWENENGMGSREYKSDDFVLDLDHLGSFFAIETILAEDVKDIEVTEFGYTFKVMKEIDNNDDKFSLEVVFNVSWDSYITSIVANGVYEKDNGEYESAHLECNYKYDNVDFSDLDVILSAFNFAS